MSKHIECDRCGKSTTFEATIRLWEKERGLWGMTFDLCRQCFKDLERLVNVKGKKQPK